MPRGTHTSTRPVWTRLDDRVGDVLGLDHLDPAASRCRPDPSSVLTTTGITIDTSISVLRTSARIASLSPTTACLVAQYVAPPGKPPFPATEAMLTRWPRLRGRKRSSASLEPRMTPLRLMSIIRAAVASVSATNGPIGMIPALLISTSSGPS